MNFLVLATLTIISGTSVLGVPVASPSVVGLDHPNQGPGNASVGQVSGDLRRSLFGTTLDDLLRQAEKKTRPKKKRKGKKGKNNKYSNVFYEYEYYEVAVDQETMKKIMEQFGEDLTMEELLEILATLGSYSQKHHLYGSQKHYGSYDITKILKDMGLNLEEILGALTMEEVMELLKELNALPLKRAQDKNNALQGGINNVLKGSQNNQKKSGGED